MRSENFLLIQGWMISELGLSGGELMAYALVYGYTKDGERWYSGGRAELVEWTSLSLKQATRCFSQLVDKGLLQTQKVGRKRYYRAVLPDERPEPGKPGQAAEALVKDVEPVLDPEDPEGPDIDVDMVVDNFVDNFVDNSVDNSAIGDKMSPIKNQQGTKCPQYRGQNVPNIGDKMSPLKDSLKDSVSIEGEIDSKKINDGRARARSSDTAAQHADALELAALSQACDGEFTMLQIVALANLLDSLPPSMFPLASNRTSYLADMYIKLCIADCDGHLADRHAYLMEMIRNDGAQRRQL